MSGWRSTKSGKHFRVGKGPGINSNTSNHSSNNSCTQSSSVNPPKSYSFRTTRGAMIHGNGSTPIEAFKDAKSFLDNARPQIKKHAGNITRGYTHTK